jgi:hypothetical protein
MSTAGVFFLVVGAVLYWVVEVDLPYVDDDALGAIAIVAGIVALTVSLLVKSPYRSRGVGSGAVGSGVGLMAAGALVYWAIKVDLPHVDDDALGAILMVAGAIAAAASVIVSSEHTETGVGAGVALIAFGAIVYWAVDLDLPYIFDDALAVILMVGGVIGVIAAVLTDVRHSRGTRARHDLAAFDRARR